MNVARHKKLKREIFHFRTNQNTAEDVKRLAAENGVTPSDLCRDAIEFYLSSGLGRILSEKASGF